MSNRYPAVSADFLLNGKPSGATFIENLRRSELNTDVAAALVTQIMTAVAIPVSKGQVISSLTFLSGATPAGTPTNWWFALYDDAATAALISQSADQLTAAWAANVPKTLALAAAYESPRSTVLYGAIMVKATTVPSLQCRVLGLASGSAAVITGQKALSVTSGAALTTTAPATLAAPTAVVNIPYCIAQ